MAYEFPPDVKVLGQAVRHLRTIRGMSLRALAAEVGVTAPFLSDVEHGRRFTDKLDKLAEVLGVNLEDLSHFDTRLPEDLKHWIESKPGLSDLLREMKASNQSVVEMRQALLRKDDDQT